MNKIKENLLLHPARLRIILAIAGRQLTAQDLASELPDIPQATLYRNINTLASAGILGLVQERRVHNTIEKTYALQSQDLRFTIEDLAKAQPGDHLRLFTQFLGLMLGYFARYTAKGDVDYARDHVLYEMFPLYLSDAEAQMIAERINNLLQPYLANESSPEHRRLIFGLASIPDDAGASHPE